MLLVEQGMLALPEYLRANPDLSGFVLLKVNFFCVLL